MLEAQRQTARRARPGRLMSECERGLDSGTSRHAHRVQGSRCARCCIQCTKSRLSPDLGAPDYSPDLHVHARFARNLFMTEALCRPGEASHPGLFHGRFGVLGHTRVRVGINLGADGKYPAPGSVWLCRRHPGNVPCPSGPLRVSALLGPLRGGRAAGSLPALQKLETALRATRRGVPSGDARPSAPPGCRLGDYRTVPRRRGTSGGRSHRRW